MEIEQKRKIIKNTLINRLLALFIDVAIIAIIEVLIATFFEAQLVLLNVHGILIGWAIVSLYWGLANGVTFSGQTIGKRAMSLEVVNIDGTYLTTVQGLKRGLLFSSLIYLPEYIKVFLDEGIIRTLLSLITISYVIGLGYFFLVNKKSHQTVHDIFCSTIVKHKEQNIDFIPTIIYKWIYQLYTIILGIIFIYIMVEVFKVNSSLPKDLNNTENTLPLNKIEGELENLDEVIIGSANLIPVKDNGIGLLIEISTKSHATYKKENELLENIDDIIVQNRIPSQIDVVIINFFYGFYIGPLSKQKSHSVSGPYYNKPNN